MNHPYAFLNDGRARAQKLVDLFKRHARRYLSRRGAPASPSGLPDDSVSATTAAADAARSSDSMSRGAMPVADDGGLTIVQVVSPASSMSSASSTSSTSSTSSARFTAPVSSASSTSLTPSTLSTPSSLPTRPDDMSPTVSGDATVVKPASRANSRMRSDSSLSNDSWQRVAQAEGGDYAAAGKLLKGRFLLDRELGRGGMGVVYLARDERKIEARDRDPYVAVKVLNDEFRRHPDSLIVLQREARRAQRLADDNIVHVYDFDKDGTIVFMTMEYIDGTDLRTVIRGRPSGMSFREAWPLIEGMARALQRAHASGIVHSDFKPGNVMVTRDGVPKVFDFGIARAGKAGAGATGEKTVFDAGTLGALTPAYASLDMILGADPSVRDDVYAFGCVIFELLTGRHPFDRHSADVAMGEGAVPPLVPGLSRRQYRALCEAVAFRGDERVQSVGALVDGLRRRKPRERLAPYFVGLLAVAALAAGGSALHSHYRDRQLETTIARFSDTDPQHYANEDQAMAALAALGPDERERLVLNQNDVIQHFLRDRLDTHWSPPLGRIDYTAVEHVSQLRDQLKLFAPGFDARRKQIDDERTDMLARLGGSLDEAVDHDALFEDQPGSAADILHRIRSLDPGSALLKSPRLELKYDSAIGQSIDFGKFDEARARITLGLQLFPDSTPLQQRRDQLTAAIASAAAHPGQHASTMSVPDARRSLTELAANPSTRKPWLDDVASAMAALQDDDAPETSKAIEALADGIVTAAARVTDPAQAHQTLDLVEVGSRYAPHSPGLAEQRDRMLLLLQLQRIDQQIASGDAAAQIDAMRLAVAANDGARALAALNRLRTLQPDNAFIASAAPQMVATAYLGKARVLSQYGKLTEAANVVSQGADAVSDDPRLSNAAQRYLVAAAILDARGKPMADPDFQDLQARFTAAQAADPDGMQQMERDISVSIPLPQGGLSAVLDQIKARIGDDTPAASAGSVSMALPAGQPDERRNLADG
jgi:non-specific serine/threonine protein kinase